MVALSKTKEITYNSNLVQNKSHIKISRIADPSTQVYIDWKSYDDIHWKEYEIKCNELQDKSDGYINTLNSATKKEYGYAIDRFYHIGDTRTDVVRVADYEWNTGTYYILDKNTYTVKETTKDYYEEIKNQNNK